jgi:cellulose synthase/poly-beta-1,6-N-acetylglucosamine synthase-like glycosyltransferase
MGPGKHCIANENVMTSQHTQTNLVLRSLAKWLLPVNLSLCVTASNALTIASAAAFTFSWWLLVQTFLFAVVVLLACYSLRHYLFTCQRLYGKQLHLHGGIPHAPWPNVVIFVAAHNEETVIADALHALMQADYPEDRIKVVPVNDRSTDNTRNVIEAVVAQYPGRIQAFHRTGGKPGKAAALKDATAWIDCAEWADIVLVFDADYLPSRGLIKQLAAPFQDPEVGAVMGRVIPQNANSNLLTRLLDLERAGGYQVDQQARSSIGSVPQYGGTVGGLRLSALDDAGGWHDDVLAEDTDITFRLLLQGWKTAYLNEAECYEEVPEHWPVRARQIGRWAKGHNQALFRHARRLFTHQALRPLEKLDGFALLLIYAMPILLMMGWVSALLLFYSNYDLALNGAVALMLMLTYASFGNFAAFYQIAAAATLDGQRSALRLLPLVIAGFLVSMVSISKATIELAVWDRLFKRQLRWDKTQRYRAASTVTVVGLPQVAV